jgi:omega-hydroxy-beta-dihydromenaquinone-9 sulfotransferase
LTAMQRAVYIVGNSRSGTTMMGRVVGNHPLVHTFPEIHYFEQHRIGNGNSEIKSHQVVELASRLLRIASEGYYTKGPINKYYNGADQLINGLVDPTSDAVYKRFMEHVVNTKEKAIACKHTPQNLFYIEEILSLFPDARFVVMMRDPRAVLLSQKRKWRRAALGANFIPAFETWRARINYHPLTISKLWNAAARETMKWHHHPQVKVVRYEDFVTNPQRVTQDLCNFIGIDYKEGMERVQKVGSSVVADETQQGMRADSQHWKHDGLNKSEVAICESVNAALMPLWNYEPSHAAGNALVTSGYYALLPFQLGAAVAMNFNRFRNIGKIIKRRLS